jgi:hypothetical protein
VKISGPGLYAMSGSALDPRLFKRGPDLAAQHRTPISAIKPGESTMNRAAACTGSRTIPPLSRAASAVLMVSALGLAPARTTVAQPAPPAADSKSTPATASRQRPQELNPQPLPPVDKPGVREKALNPQPLPPIDKPSARAKALNPQPLPPIDKPGVREKALNPQPLPPIDKPGASAKALNPQPLPPVDGNKVGAKPGR